MNMCEDRNWKQVLEEVRNNKGKKVKWRGHLTYSTFRERSETGKLRDGLYNLNSSGSWFFTYINEEFEWV